MQDPLEIVHAFEQGQLSRRQLIVGLMASGAALASVPGLANAAQRPGPQPTPSPPESTFKALDLNHIALTVTDVPRSRVFYEQHLGMTARGRIGQQSCFLNCGRDWIALFRGPKAGLHHYCYSIPDYDPEDAMKRLEKAGLKPRRREDRVYFDDPDGLEVQVGAPNRAASGSSRL